MGWTNLDGLYLSNANFSNATIGTATITTGTITTGTITTGTVTTLTADAFRLTTTNPLKSKAIAVSDGGFSNLTISGLTTSDLLIGAWQTHYSDGGYVAVSNPVPTYIAASSISLASPLSNVAAVVLYWDRS